MRLQGFPCYGCEHACLWDKGFALECLRFYERFIGFHSPLRGNPLNVFAIISLITISALGQSLDLTKIRNWKLLSQYKAINLCHPAVIVAQGNNVVSWPTWSHVVILFRMSAFISTDFVTPRLTWRAPVLYLDCVDTIQIPAVCFSLCLLLLFSTYSCVKASKNKVLSWHIGCFVTVFCVLRKGQFQVAKCSICCPIQMKVNFVHLR